MPQNHTPAQVRASQGSFGARARSGPQLQRLMYQGSMPRPRKCHSRSRFRITQAAADRAIGGGGEMGKQILPTWNVILPGPFSLAPSSPSPAYPSLPVPDMNHRSSSDAYCTRREHERTASVLSVRSYKFLEALCGHYWSRSWTPLVFSVHGGASQHPRKNITNPRPSAS